MKIVLERSLITWRLTNLVVKEQGPFNIFEKFRDTIGVYSDEFSLCAATNQLAKAFCCFWCASLWVGVSVALGYRENPVRGLIYSAGAIWIERMTK